VLAGVSGLRLRASPPFYGATAERHGSARFAGATPLRVSPLEDFPQLIHGCPQARLRRLCSPMKTVDLRRWLQRTTD